MRDEISDDLFQTLAYIYRELRVGKIQAIIENYGEKKEFFTDISHPFFLSEDVYRPSRQLPRQIARKQCLDALLPFAPALSSLTDIKNYTSSPLQELLIGQRPQQNLYSLKYGRFSISTIAPYTHRPYSWKGRETENHPPLY